MTNNGMAALKVLASTTMVYSSKCHLMDNDGDANAWHCVELH